jgi:rubrerythrin
MPLTLAQALRNVIDAEHAAARFYGQLVSKAGSDRVRDLLRELAAQEEQHAAAAEKMAEQLRCGELPGEPDVIVEEIEAIPSWLRATVIDLRQALEVALEAEQHAALYYDALADASEGETARLFRQMVLVEERHAEMIASLQRDLGRLGRGHS